MKTIIYTLIFSLFVCPLHAQKEFLQSGPMLGYNGYKEILLWAQTKSKAQVQFAIWKQNSTDTVYTEKTETERSLDYIAKIKASGLEMGTQYQYCVFINDKLVKRPYPCTFKTFELWQWRKDPPTIEFAIGSCSYISEESHDRPGNPYGGGYEIFKSISEKKPEFMLWLGDNTYLRDPDFYSQSGIFYRYRHTRALPEIQALLANTHHYAIWDDHDYGPNDSDRTYYNKQLTEKAFNLYWGNPNTNQTNEGGITGAFNWADVAFFLMDNRYHRQPNQLKSKDKQMLGKVQVDWLIESLKSNKASFKIVCIGGQTINNAAVYENYAIFEDERSYLLNRLEEEAIEGVLFLSGDRHHSEISKLDRPNAYPLFDITSSPLTSGTHKPRNEGNLHYVEGTGYYERNFGIIKVSGPLKDRVLEYTLNNALGDSVYTYTIRASSLRYKH